MKISKFAGALFVCLMGGPLGLGLSHAQQETWTTLAGPVGAGESGTLSDVYFTSATTGYVLLNPGSSGNPRIFKTTNGGAGWASTTVSANPKPSLYGIHCPTANICYAVGNNGFVKTTDGTNWSTLTLIPGATGQNEVYFTSPDTGYAIGNNTTCKSANGGNTWTCTGGGGNAIHCPSADICYSVGAAGSLRRTSNAGASWNSLTSPTAEAIHSIHCPTPSRCFAVGDHGVILKTTDSGSNWSLDTTAVRSLSDVRFTSPDTGYATGYIEQLSVPSLAVTLKTVNGGATWFYSYLESAPLGSYPQALAFSDARTAYVVGGGQSGAPFVLKMSGPATPVLKDGTLRNPAVAWRNGRLEYRLDAASEARAVLLASNGREIRTLFDGPQRAGAHSIPVNTSALAKGIYLLDFRAGSEHRTISIPVL